MSHALRVLHESEMKRILHDEHVMHASGISQDMTVPYTDPSYVLKHAHTHP